MCKEIKTFEYGKRNQTDVSDLAKHVLTLIEYYYKDIGNLTGGNLHVVLDDGNVDRGFIVNCANRCVEYNDSLGYLICDLLLSFSDDDIDAMADYFWGMEWHYD